MVLVSVVVTFIVGFSVVVTICVLVTAVVIGGGAGWKEELLKSFTGKNVLVTGATGFIGSYIVKKLLRENINVRVLCHKKNIYS